MLWQSRTEAGRRNSPGSLRKFVAEHGQAALCLFLRGLVLNHVPVLDEQPVLETNNIGGDPVHRRAKARETAMDNHEISPGEDDACLILQRGWIAFDEIEQALSARLNMIAVLNVVR